MFDKTPHAMALLGTFQQECAEAILAFKQSPEQTPASVQEPAPEQPTATSRWQGATPPSKNDVANIGDASMDTTPDELSNESPESSDWLSDFSDGLDRENRNRFSKSPSTRASLN